MKSQVYWGLGFIVFGVLILLVLLPVEFTVALIYGIPFILIGIILLIFKNRESKIEK